MVHVPGAPAADRLDRRRRQRGGSRVLSVPGPRACHDRRSIVADRLGVPIESVRVPQPDTSAAPPGTGTFASRGAIAAGRRGGRRGEERAGGAIATRRRRARGEPRRSRAGRRSGERARCARARPVRGRSRADRALGAAPRARPDARALEATEVFDPPGPLSPGAVHVASAEADPETGRVHGPRVTRSCRICGHCHQLADRRGADPRPVAQGLGEALGSALSTTRMVAPDWHAPTMRVRWHRRFPTSRWAISRRPRRSRRAATRGWARAAPSARPPPSPMRSPTRSGRSASRSRRCRSFPKGCGGEEQQPDSMSGAQSPWAAQDGAGSEGEIDQPATGPAD